MGGQKGGVMHHGGIGNAGLMFIVVLLEGWQGYAFSRIRHEVMRHFVAIW